MTKLTAASINLSPSALGDTQATFLLSKAEWLAVQTFVNAALALPTTLPLLGSKLPSKPTGGLDSYQDLVNAYKALNTSCSKFETDVLPSTIRCASNLISYNLKAGRFYRAILTEYRKMIDKAEKDLTDAEKATNKTVLKNVKALCDNLSKDAKSYADHAATVLEGLNSFAKDTGDNQRAITDLNTLYTAKLTGTDGSITKLKKQLEEEMAELKVTQDEYDHDVVVAATTATYVFAWPFGTVAAGIVMGIYTDKAIKAKAKIEAFQKHIEQMGGTLKADTIISLDLTQIKTDLGSIGAKIQAALPHINKIQGMWKGLNDSLDNIVKIIAEDIDGQDVDVILDNAIETAIDAWKIISDKAETYRTHAYIKVVDEKDTVKMIASVHELNRKLKMLHAAA